MYIYVYIYIYSYLHIYTYICRYSSHNIDVQDLLLKRREQISPKNSFLFVAYLKVFGHSKAFGGLHLQGTGVPPEQLEVQGHLALHVGGGPSGGVEDSFHQGV